MGAVLGSQMAGIKIKMMCSFYILSCMQCVASLCFLYGMPCHLTMVLRFLSIKCCCNSSEKCGKLQAPVSGHIVQV